MLSGRRKGCLPWKENKRMTYQPLRGRWMTQVLRQVVQCELLFRRWIHRINFPRLSDLLKANMKRTTPQTPHWMAPCIHKSNTLLSTSLQPSKIKETGSFRNCLIRRKPSKKTHIKNFKKTGRISKWLRNTVISTTEQPVKTSKPKNKASSPQPQREPPRPFLNSSNFQPTSPQWVSSPPNLTPFKK